MGTPPEDVTFEYATPETADFIALREECGWERATEQDAETALANTLCSVCCYEGETLIGMGRIIGDGALYFFVEDIVVRPAYQGQQVGKTIVDMLLAKIAPMQSKVSCTGLFAAKGKEGFYSRFGFSARPSETKGAGMTKFP